MSQEVLVFAHWMELVQPALVGTLRSDLVCGKEHFGFSYADDWLQLPWVQQIDPQLGLYQGAQHKEDDRNFRIFLDSCPDDGYDMGAWEYLVYLLAREAGVDMAESRLVKLNGYHHTFMTRRFDRRGSTRLHFTSAITWEGGG